MKGYPAGVVTALNFAVQAVTDPGDEILIPSPVYAPLYIVSKDGVHYYLADGHEVNEDALIMASQKAHDWKNPIWRNEDGTVAEW